VQDCKRVCTASQRRRTVAATEDTTQHSDHRELCQFMANTRLGRHLTGPCCDKHKMMLQT